MQVIEGLPALARAPAGMAAEPSVVTVGVFDGVHLGHLRLLHELAEFASERHAIPTVVTFASHPDALLRGSAPPPLISLSHRLRLLRRAGVARVVVLTFDTQLRDMAPDEFARRVLGDGLATKGLLLGFDAALCRDRAGTPARFRQIGATMGFTVRESAVFVVDDQPVSSTRIRNAIQAGELELARRLLGRWPSTFGPVRHGDARGRSLGYPTANVAPESSALPPAGVYAVEAIVDGEPFFGVANLGQRPTFDAATDGSDRLEVHLFDQPQGLDLYHKSIEVSFVARLRAEQRFADLDALRQQIARDVAAARAVFSL